MTTATRVVFVGDIGTDIVVRVAAVPEPDEKVLATDFFETVGGVTTNAAVACARAGVPTTLCVGIGDDLKGRAASAALAAEGVDAPRTVPRSTIFRALILIDDSGEKRVVLGQSAAMYPPVDVVASVALDDVAWVHTAAYDRTASQLLADRCRASGIPFSLDLEPATMPAGLADIEALLPACQTAFVNARAHRVLGSDAVTTLLDSGVAEVVQTLGQHGARLHTGEFVVDIVAPQLNKPAVDTTGAGDALAGWNAASRSAGQDAVTSLIKGVAAATISVGTLGASASYPHPRDVDRMTEKISTKKAGLHHS